ncbi:MAG: hypothetical protein IKL23_01730 [Oscillospiraceae bacterium]|nr:hypothetical protein [Oscillospiraceae bacterium]
MKKDGKDALRRWSRRIFLYIFVRGRMTAVCRKNAGKREGNPALEEKKSCFVKKRRGLVLQK